MDENYLAQRFCSLWQDCAGAEPAQVWASLRQHYQEPHRFYHTLGHLAHCLGELDHAKAVRWPFGSTTSSMSMGQERMKY